MYGFTQKTWRKGKKSTGENAKKNPVETLRPEIQCRFLFLVVVERALIHGVRSLLKKSSAESQRFCRTLRAKPSFADPANSSPQLSGMFRRSASLAIPHLKSFAAIPSVSLVQLGHTNRNVFLSHESQREIALV